MYNLLWDLFDIRAEVQSLTISPGGRVEWVSRLTGGLLALLLARRLLGAQQRAALARLVSRRHLTC